MRELEWNNFNEYPHYVYATAFLVNGELADYKIQNREREWGDRTFRGTKWENEVWQHGFIDKDWNLTCEYNKILVNKALTPKYSSDKHLTKTILQRKLNKSKTACPVTPVKILRKAFSVLVDLFTTFTPLKVYMLYMQFPE